MGLFDRLFGTADGVDKAEALMRIDELSAEIADLEQQFLGAGRLVPEKTEELGVLRGAGSKFRADDVEAAERVLQRRIETLRQELNA